MIVGKYLIMAGIVVSVLALTACGGRKAAGGDGKSEAQAQGQVQKRERSEYVKLKPEEAKERMDSDEEIIIVDVRTPEEYAESRIGDAINIPVEDIGDEQPEALSDLEAKIMVYCRSGVRSKKAAQKLLDLGYKNIMDIGGIIDWPYETVAGEEK